MDLLTHMQGESDFGKINLLKIDVAQLGDFLFNEPDVPIDVLRKGLFFGGNLLSRDDIGTDLHCCQRVIEFVTDGDDKFLDRLGSAAGDQIGPLLFLDPLLEDEPLKDIHHCAGKNRVRCFVLYKIVVHPVCHDLNGKPEIPAGRQEDDRDARISAPERGGSNTSAVRRARSESSGEGGPALASRRGMG